MCVNKTLSMDIVGSKLVKKFNFNLVKKLS